MKLLPYAVSAATALLLSACAVSPPAPPGTVVPDAKASQIQPGVTTKAELLAMLGPTTSIRFDSGVEVWRYLLPGPGGQAPFGEYVVVLDPRGVVSKTRRAAEVYQ
jgi:outer membrane protein assembly factor BamE (lipoprotein component of BamABCDE complex)